MDTEYHYWLTGLIAKRSEEKEQTNWYHFQEAVKKHREFSFDLIKPRFDDAGIEVVCE